VAIKRLFGRGIGFNDGAITWVVTRGYSIGAAVQSIYAIIGEFSDKRPRALFSDMRPSVRMRDQRPRMPFTMPEVDDG
jgi:hypothetical protein